MEWRLREYYRVRASVEEVADAFATASIYAGVMLTSMFFMLSFVV